MIRLFVASFIAVVSMNLTEKSFLERIEMRRNGSCLVHSDITIFYKDKFSKMRDEYRVVGR